MGCQYKSQSWHCCHPYKRNPLSGERNDCVGLNNCDEYNDEPKNNICKHCTACGDVKACRETECHQHESWYAMEQERRINALCMAIHNEGMYKQRYDMLRRSLFAILDSGCNQATMLARTEQAVNRHRGIKPVGTPMAQVDPVDPVKQNKE